MNYILSLFLLLTAFSKLPAHNQSIVFTDLHNTQGTIYIACYQNDEDFPKANKAFRTTKVNATGLSTVTTVLEDLPPGTYAIAAFLDENGNGKMDTNVFGIPKEKYGFSNNARPMMRAATFKEAAFVVGNNTQPLTIKLK